ncbi:MAG: PhzF family phenazine biosynthesis protein [Robiginitomaculum sp.]|nr:PhzF family phenazine biosynthesis protein [Robiginitomaculum sp.]
MKLDIYQIDAFSNGEFTGNPAAVIPLSKPLDPILMQNIAMENNLSETAFIVASNDPSHWNLRWFTPTTEVPLCGHATFASGVCVLRHLHPDLGKVTFTTASGLLSVERDGQGFIVDLPAAKQNPWQPSSDLVKALEVKVIASAGADFPFIVVDDSDFVRNLNIEEGVQLANLTESGELIISAPGDGAFDFLTRVFVPGVGIDEDPVTGAAFAQITAYWANRLNRNKMQALQASKRGGLVNVELHKGRVRIGGGAVDFMHGQIEIG